MVRFVYILCKHFKTYRFFEKKNGDCSQKKHEKSKKLNEKILISILHNYIMNKYIIYRNYIKRRYKRIYKRTYNKFILFPLNKNVKYSHLF